MIETDGDLRSLACYCYGMKIATMEIKVNVCMSSMSSCSGASTSSSSGSSSYLIGGEVVGHKTYKSDFWWRNFDGGVRQRFALGAPEFRCKLIEYSIVSGYKYELIKNDDFRVTAVCQKKNELNCQWCIHSWESYGYFEIKKINLTHTCDFAVKDYDHPPLTSYLVKTHILDFARDKPDLTAPYEYWANAYFCGAQYSEMCSSLAECFNSWIDKERHIPITAMLDGIRMKMMKMASAWRMECKNWKSFLCPKIEAKLLETTERAHSVTVTNSTYSHGITAISRNEICSDGSNEVRILPPDVKKPPDRPRVKRIESAGAMCYTAHKCRKCDSTDRHDRKNCQGKIVDVLTTE
ncbi:hypothetical protein IFM89_031016 [Coptis chinensis]|uniref:Transposase MuDR plant domain-containing protein n=1 Tax=Coptis chinensis TaxID=261450 RepID=A0A835LJZ9_9MAGN|nr:hypothetical protein IFM89_031016 [Coptis chinensis]